MAIAPLNKFLTIAVPVAPGEQTIYTAPVGTSAIVLYAQVSNVGIGQSYPTVTFTHRRTSVATRTAGNVRNNRIIKDGEIPPNDSLILIDGRLVLERTAIISDSIVITGVQTGITTVFDVKYTSSTGVTTVTTIDPHGFGVNQQVTMAGIAFTCPSTAGITSSLFPAPQASFTITGITGDAGTSKTFTTNTGIVNSLPHTYRPAFHRFLRSDANSINEGNAVGSLTGTQLTPTNALYDPITGFTTFTVANHSLTTSTSLTAQTAVYDPVAGIMTVTVTGTPSPAFEDNQYVKFEEGSITFNCNYGGGGNESYPRFTDPARGRYLKISNTTSTTFEVNVGVGNVTNPHTFVSAVSNGIKRARSTITLDVESLVFSCSQDYYGSEHRYPRATDPVGLYKTMGVDVIDSNTFSVYTGVSTSGGLVGPLQMEFICSILENSTT
jgi:hypothetical protein